ncbi:hypothetical protein BJ875DRAFT_122856 [Amylocarpus encephaloides]|uniref:Uncharacterized protein n=1 Tax=Amylocarpus encephaloides TaxID=45428 RepID=A0A9P8C2D7_9HELO|nr:hypothetical protein BJ875DRAFT_122856 [Amylocarpus encephaloides]
MKPSKSWQHLETTALQDQPRMCKHIFLSQVQYGGLPGLYFTPLAQQGLMKNAFLQLGRALLDMGVPKVQPSHVAREVGGLRRELSGGMSRDRKELMRQHVLGLRTERERRVAELYLARYPGFVLDENGKLDYGLRD